MTDPQPARNERPDWTDARASAVRIKSEKAERRLARGEATPSDRRLLGLDPQPIARMADCEEHGLHGARERCFDCDRPVRHPIYVALRWAIPVALVLVILGFLIGALTI